MVRWGRLLVLLVVAGGLVGCRGRVAPPPLQLGHVANLSGPDRIAGEQATLGIRLAVAEHNQDIEQGIGCPLLVRHTDAHGQVEAFEAEAVRLAAVNKVAALLGGHTDGEVARLERARLPLLTPLGQRGSAVGEQVFATGLSPVFVGQVLARFAVGERRATQATLWVAEQDDYYAQAAAAFAKEFSAQVSEQQKNSRPVLTTVILAKETKWKELVQNQARDKGGCVLLAAPAKVLAELAQSGQMPALLMWAGPDGGWAGTGLGRPQGAILFATAFDEQAPRSQEFFKQFRAAFKQDPDVHAALAYDNMRLLIAGLRQLKPPFPPDKLVEELAKVKDFAGLAGSMSFGPDRRLRRPAFVAQMAEGRVQVLKRYDPERNAE